mgnify:CR=1 FL=1
MNFQPIEPIRPLWAELTEAAGAQSVQRQQPTLFSDVLQSVVDNAREAEKARSEAEYLLATGQMDNPSEYMVAASQAELSVSLLVQLRNRALDAYSEIMRMSI